MKKRMGVSEPKYKIDVAVDAPVKIVDGPFKDFDGKVKFVKINIDENQFYAGEYAVMSIPTLIFFKKGEETDRNVGALNKDSLKAWITKNI